ncbi:uncharacterized protein LOC113680022, partial [Pocillopora damicornis]|uniref:uncharacterized protein LOC113680022 n=1 Tax=Pocillopora damicornis TaxID=46731 RepID=UPI000F553D78
TTRGVLVSYGDVSCPDGFIYHKGDPLKSEQVRYPCVVKASQGEDTKAVRLVKDSKLLNAAIEHALSYSDHVIIESYIEGREIRRAVVESAANGELKALSCIEYKVRENDIRRTEDKLSCNEKGLPVGKYWRYMSLIPTTTLAINISATKPHFQGVVRLIGFTVQKFLNPK